MDVNDYNVEIQRLQKQRDELLLEEKRKNEDYIRSLEWCYGQEADLHVCSFHSYGLPKYELKIHTSNPSTCYYINSFVVFGEMGADYRQNIFFCGHPQGRAWPEFSTNNARLLADFIPRLKLKTLKFDRDTMELYNAIEEHLP